MFYQHIQHINIVCLLLTISRQCSHHIRNHLIDFQSKAVSVNISFPVEVVICSHRVILIFTDIVP